MPANLNKVLLIGNLTREPDLRYIPSGTAVANFGMAINRTYTDANGEKQDDVCFVDIICWNRLAEACGQYLHKGSPAFVEGRLQMRTWEKEDGQKITKLEIVAQNVQFLGGAKHNADEENPGKEPDDVPF